MRKILSIVSLLSLGTATYYAQVGINTPDPGSTLHVNGSLAAQYRAVSATTYAMNETDYHVSYNGTGNATFTLPAAITGSGNFKGRLYTIKNNTPFTVTINPAISETIGNNTNIALAANQSVQIINTGLTGAVATWEVIARNNTTDGVGCLPDYAFASLTATEAYSAGNTILFNTQVGTGISLNSGEFTLKAGKTYELEANLFGVNFSSVTAGVISATWVNVANNNSVLPNATVAEFYPLSYTVTPNSIMPITRAIITPTADMTVAVRITGGTGFAYIRGGQSYAMIKQLNSCGSGGGSTPVVTNVTASNGLNASGNDVKLGGTLSQATDIATAGNNLTVSGTGNVGIGTTSPTNKLEVNSGTANVSGLKLTNLTSATPIGTGQTIGVDSNGNVITMANATAATVNTWEVASTSGADYNVSDLGWTIVSGTTQTINIPVGGKALFINFMLGIDYVNIPNGSSISYYSAKLYIDDQETNVYLTAQENGAGTQAQFNLSSVKFLTQGNHKLEVKMSRTRNGGVASGVVMQCRPISMSFNASYIN